MLLFFVLFLMKIFVVSNVFVGKGEGAKVVSREPLSQQNASVKDICRK